MIACEVDLCKHAVKLVRGDVVRRVRGAVLKHEVEEALDAIEEERAHIHIADALLAC